MKTTTNTTSTSTLRMIVMFAMLLLSGVSFGQTLNSVPSVVSTDTTVSTTTATETNSNMNMVSWFMGSKQTTREGISNESSAKKQMMTSGIAPNRLLIKTLLKKASNYATNVA